MLDENSVLVDIFGPLCEIQAEKLTLKITKFLGGKSVNELIVSNFEFSNPVPAESIQYIGSNSDRLPYYVIAIL